MMIFYRIHLRGSQQRVLCVDKPINREKHKKNKDVLTFHDGTWILDCSLVSMVEPVPDGEKSQEKSLAYARYKGKQYYDKVYKFQEMNDAFMPLDRIENLDKPLTLPPFNPEK